MRLYRRRAPGRYRSVAMCAGAMFVVLLVMVQSCSKRRYFRQLVPASSIEGIREPVHWLGQVDSLTLHASIRWESTDPRDTSGFEYAVSFYIVPQGDVKRPDPTWLSIDSVVLLAADGTRHSIYRMSDCECPDELSQPCEGVRFGGLLAFADSLDMCVFGTLSDDLHGDSKPVHLKSKLHKRWGTIP